MAALLAGACGWLQQGSAFDADHSDFTPQTVRHFQEFPVFWVGERFEGYRLHAIVGGGGDETLTFIYGSCKPAGDDGGCSPPIEIQQEPLCAHLAAVARNPRWRHRRVRGAPVGSNDSAPVLFARHTQIKVYAAVPHGTAVALRVLGALRSANHVGPVVDPGDPIPAASTSILSGARPCG